MPCVPTPNPPASNPDLGKPHRLKPRTESKRADRKQGTAAWLRAPVVGLSSGTSHPLPSKWKLRGKRITRTLVTEPLMSSSGHS